MKGVTEARGPELGGKLSPIFAGGYLNVVIVMSVNDKKLDIVLRLWYYALNWYVGTKESGIKERRNLCAVFFV